MTINGLMVAMFVFVAAMERPCQGVENSNYLFHPPCHLHSIPSFSLQPDSLAGKWYLKMQTNTLPYNVNLTGLEIEFQTEIYQGKQYLTMKEKRSYRGDPTSCVEIYDSCVLTGNFCYMLRFRYKATIVFAVYTSILGVYLETTVNGKIFPWFSIYVRNPLSDPNLSFIQSELQQFCGANAKDATSSFYSTILRYEHTSHCFDWVVCS